jgi:hypothetical protein
MWYLRGAAEYDLNLTKVIRVVIIRVVIRGCGHIEEWSLEWLLEWSYKRSGFNRCVSYKRSGFNRCVLYKISGFNRCVSYRRSGFIVYYTYKYLTKALAEPSSPSTCRGKGEEVDSRQ